MVGAVEIDLTPVEFKLFQNCDEEELAEILMNKVSMEELIKNIDDDGDMVFVTSIHADE